MSVSGVGGAGAASYSSSPFKAAGQSSGESFDSLLPDTTSSPATADSAIQEFLKFARETPGQRMVDLWLKAHHLTQEELNNMPPAQRDAVEKQMQQDIQNSIKKKTAENAAAVKTNLLV